MTSQPHFNPSAHPRGQAGRFTTKQAAEAEVALGVMPVQGPPRHGSEPSGSERDVEAQDAAAARDVAAEQAAEDWSRSAPGEWASAWSSSEPPF